MIDDDDEPPDVGYQNYPIPIRAAQPRPGERRRKRKKHKPQSHVSPRPTSPAASSPEPRATPPAPKGGESPPGQEGDGDGPDEPDDDPGDVEGQFTGPGEVAALQASIKADLEVVRAALRRCVASNTFNPDKNQADWDAWQSMRQRAEAYLAESPAILSTVSQYERGEVIQRELAAWHDRAKALGCDVAPAPMLPAPQQPFFAGLGAGMGGTLLLLLALWLWKGK